MFFFVQYYLSQNLQLQRLFIPIIGRSLSLNNFYKKQKGNNVVELANDRQLELTLAIIKPHICKDPYSLQAIKAIILKNKFLFVQSTQLQMTQTQAQLFYKEHRGKFFYNRLVALMTSGESSVHILARNDAITQWRKLMGPTKVFKARLDQPETIRGIYGVTDTRNATHGSDSPEMARKEIEFFFPNFSLDEWFQQEEPIWRKLIENQRSKIFFDENEWIHRINHD